MNALYVELLELAITSFLVIGIIIIIIMLFINKRKSKLTKNLAIALIIFIMQFSLIFTFEMSHSTYYKYNDWFALDNKIQSIKDKYGEFDIGEYTYGKEGTVGYYIYTDNGPVMPDHLKHYYYLEYDEFGKVYNVFDGSQPGG